MFLYMNLQEFTFYCSSERDEPDILLKNFYLLAPFYFYRKVIQSEIFAMNLYNYNAKFETNEAVQVRSS
jgi:hypothetical protein